MIENIGQKIIGAVIILFSVIMSGVYKTPAETLFFMPFFAIGIFMLFGKLFPDGTLANTLPHKGEFILASTPTRLDKNNVKVFDDSSLLINMQKIENGERKKIKGYIVRSIELKPGDDLTQIDLFNHLLEAKKDDELSIYPSGRMYLRVY